MLHHQHLTLSDEQKVALAHAALRCSEISDRLTPDEVETLWHLRNGSDPFPACYAHHVDFLLCLVEDLCDDLGVDWDY